MSRDLAVGERLKHDEETAEYLGRYGTWVHRYFESWGGRHIHEVARDGSHFLVGNGVSILRIIKPSRRKVGGEVWKIDPLNYADYFLPHEMEG
jgi:hypothetical protein